MASAIIRTDGNARRLDDRYDAFLEELVVEARSHDVVANVSLSLSALGHKRTFRSANVLSPFLPKANGGGHRKLI
jgi:hypothetical protein